LKKFKAFFVLVLRFRELRGLKYFYAIRFYRSGSKFRDSAKYITTKYIKKKVQRFTKLFIRLWLLCG
jgi:hypothetical protein